MVTKTKRLITYKSKEIQGLNSVFELIHGKIDTRNMKFSHNNLSLDYVF